MCYLVMCVWVIDDVKSVRNDEKCGDGFKCVVGEGDDVIVMCVNVVLIKV